MAADHIEVEDEGQEKLADLMTTALLAAEAGVLLWPCASLCAQCRFKDKNFITRIRTTKKQTNKQIYRFAYKHMHIHRNVY